MKFINLLALALLATSSYASAAMAQNPPVPPSPPQPTADEVLAACAEDKADTLPNPFLDLSPNHWAYKAVLSIYYCGAYRGSIPPEKAKPVLEKPAS